MRTNYKGHDSKYVKNKALRKPGWDDTKAGYIQFKEEVQKVLDRGFAPSQGKLLELGCGAGNMSLWFAEKGYETFGVDIAPTAIQWARERAATKNTWIQFCIGDVVQLNDYKNASFDFVFDGHCLHCIIGNDRNLMLENIFRILKPGGYVMFNTMCSPVFPEKLENYDAESKCTIHKDVATRYFGDTEFILNEIKTAGFEVIHQELQTCTSEKSVSYIVIEARKPVEGLNE